MVELMGSAFVHAESCTPFGHFGDAMADVQPGESAAVPLRGVHASVVLLGYETAATRMGHPPSARDAGRETSAVGPPMFGCGPVEAAGRAPARAGISWADVSLVEPCDGASQVLAVGPEKVS